MVGKDLVITQLVLEVDSRFGGYGRCNICVNGSDHHGHNNCTDGEYICGCGDPHAPPHGGQPTVPCGAAVGKENLTDHYAGRACAKGSSEWDCWKDNVVKKTGGFWYSTFKEGYCGDESGDNNNTAGTAAGSSCMWRVAEVKKRVSKVCSDNTIFGRVETHGTDCFKACDTAFPLGPKRNTSDACWIRCFYATAIGTSKIGERSCVCVCVCVCVRARLLYRARCTSLRVNCCTHAH